MALYPPIVASSMPAFDITDGQVRIYFSLSPYNTTKISNLATQVSIRRQSSNVSVLSSSTQMITKSIQQNNKGYYITISNDDISEGFIEDVLYKVQLRLILADESGGNQYNTFTNDINTYSEWSTVCIIKPVVVPQFYIDSFHAQGQVVQQVQNYFYLDAAEFLGVFKPGEGGSEILKSWRLRLLDSSYNAKLDTIESKTLADSGIKIISAYNYSPITTEMVFDCSLPYNFKNNKNNATQYKLLFEITTLNDYQGKVMYEFTYSENSSDAPVITNSKVYVNEEEGYVRLNFEIVDTSSSTNTDPYYNYVIRRTDSKSGFGIWQDIYNFTSRPKTIEYYDFTVESGTLYQYCLQKRDVRGRRSKEAMIWVNGDAIEKEQFATVLAEWEHSFLLQSNYYKNNSTGNFKQLKLKYDFQISSYKTNISQSKVDTIGGKYPYIRRNGNMYYRSFPCTGTITGLMDNAELFVSKNKMLEGKKNQYDQLKGLDQIYQPSSSQYNYTYERKFRQQVQQFLYNMKPKLYKSAQEGNILVKLMQVSLTPKTQLGRLIYTFSATAYEIDEPSLTNLDKYNIINIGTYDTKLGRWKTQEYIIDQGDPPVQEEYDQFIQQLSSCKTVITGESGSAYQERVQYSNLFKGGYDIIGTESTVPAFSNSAAVLNDYGVSFTEYRLDGKDSNDDDDARIVTKLNFKYIRITVESKPYLIVSRDGVLYPVKDTELQDVGAYGGTTSSIDKKLYQMESTLEKIDYYLGTLFTINGEQILISPPNNVYQIKEQNFSGIDHLSIIPAKDTALTIDYVVKVWDEQDLTKVPKVIKTNKINGQLEGTFAYDTDLINQIKTYYKQDYQLEESNVKRTLQGVNQIRVEAAPDTWIQIRTKHEQQQSAYENVYMNFTGDLEYDAVGTNTYITGLKFLGKRVSRELCHEGFTESSGIPATQYDVKTIEQEIFYQNKWCDIKYTDAEYFYFEPSRRISALVYYFATEKERYY